jgi:hypothetical protein
VLATAEGSAEHGTLNNGRLAADTTPPVYTIDVSDASGNLVDVYEPAVTDADPQSPTYGLTVSPRGIPRSCGR